MTTGKTIALTKTGLFWQSNVSAFLFFFSFNLFVYFNWRLIALQYWRVEYRKWKTKSSKQKSRMKQNKKVEQKQKTKVWTSGRVPICLLSANSEENNFCMLLGWERGVILPPYAQSLPSFLTGWTDISRTSLVAQWLRTCFPMQKTWVSSSFGELRSICCGASKPHPPWLLSPPALKAMQYN